MSSEPVINILVRMPNWLGDCVMAMPALRHLSESMPGARIFLAGREQFRQLFRDQAGVAGFVQAPSSGFGQLMKGMSDTRRSVRDAGLPAIDLGLLFTNSLSTAAWMWRTGATHRVGYDLDCRRFFLTHPVPCGGLETSWHFVRYYLWLATFAESILREAEAVSPRQVEPLADYMLPALRVGEESREAAAALLRECGLEGRYAVIAPASAYGPVKDWPAEHYRELVKTINRDYKLPVAVTGGGGQAEICQSIADGQKAAVNLAGRTSLDQFAGLLADAALFVGGDSGGAHVAGALRVPTVVIFGITNPTRTRPGGTRVRHIGDGEDRDVKLSTPSAREKARKALEAIAPDRVAAAAGEAMQHDQR